MSQDMIAASHGEEFGPVAGAFFRVGQSGRLCVCPDCRAAHRRAARAGGGWYQGQLVHTPGGVGSVYQSGGGSVWVDLVASPVLYVLRYDAAACRVVSEG